MRYGLPIQGSKNRLADRIIELLPPAGHLYDVFAGGGAVSHCALLSGKWGCVHFSDTNDTVVLFRDCMEGNVPDGSEWIGREEFEKRKDFDPWVRLIYSFGTNQRDYLYSRKIEPYKKAVHEMIFAPTPAQRRMRFREVCRLMPLVTGRPSDHESTERMQAVQAEFGSVIREWDGRYRMAVADYRDIEILPDSVIYCDPPYRNKREYRNDTFDYDAFYEWTCLQKVPVYISEFWMPEDRFECIASFHRRSTFSATNNRKQEVEKIFRPKNQLTEK